MSCITTIQKESFCSFCYKYTCVSQSYHNFDLKDYQSETSAEENKTTSTVNRFLKVITRLANEKGSSVFTVGQDNKKWLRCCKNCLELMTLLCDMHHEIHCLQLKMEERLGSLLDHMKLADRVPSRLKKVRQFLQKREQTDADQNNCQDPSEENEVGTETRIQREMKDLQNFRSEVMAQCGKRLSHTQPRVLIQKSADRLLGNAVEKQNEIPFSIYKSEVMSRNALETQMDEDMTLAVVSWLISLVALAHVLSPLNNVTPPTTNEIYTINETAELGVDDDMERVQWESQQGTNDTISNNGNDIDTFWNSEDASFVQEERENNDPTAETPPSLPSMHKETESCNDANVKKRVQCKEPPPYQHPFKCQLCFRRYRVKEALEVHLELKHAKKQRNCRLKTAPERRTRQSVRHVTFGPTTNTHDDNNGTKRRRLSVGTTDAQEDIRENNDAVAVVLKKKPVATNNSSAIMDPQAGYVGRNEWEVESVLSSGISRRPTTGEPVKWYFVKWKKWDSIYNQAVAEQDICSTVPLKAYWKTVAGKINDLNQPNLKIHENNVSSNSDTTYFAV